MLSASSPITFPASSSPPPRKRAKPHDYGHPPTKSRLMGPFVQDEEDAEDDTDQNAEPPAKRRILETSADEQIPAIVEEPLQNNESQNPPELASATDPDDNEPEQTNSRTEPSSSFWSNTGLLFTEALTSGRASKSYTVKTCNGHAASICQRKQSAAPSYESIVAARSRTKEGRAKRSYYGIEIHELVNEIAKEQKSAEHGKAQASNNPMPSTEAHPPLGKRPKRTLLWTEKYRARSFMDLCGDDGTNRLVLRWLKRWDPVVFPGAARSKPAASRRPGAKQEPDDEKPLRKILMLTGPPGLGKTTLAHVCAKQAGYEVMEVNASDERSRDVVKNRIRTSLGTESVKTISNSKNKDDGRSPKVAKPACVVVDEVDGVVSGSGGSGEGGFVRALMDLVQLDQKNNSGANTTEAGQKKKKKDDDFRLMRPLILICNDVYHPSLRPLRQSNLAEIIHVGRPSLDAVVLRLQSVFEKEGIPCDKDAARKLCEAAWGMTSGIDTKRGVESAVEGDLRGVMVVGEWVAGRFKASASNGGQRLTKQWIDANILHDLTSGAAGSRGLGRGNVKDIVTRLFQEGGGFPKQAMDFSGSKTNHEQPKTELGFGEQQKKYAMSRLAQMVDTSGEVCHILTEIFAEYPNREFNDDCYLTKPNLAYDWLYFHDACQARLFNSQEWELAPYLNQPVLACHHLFASPKRHYADAPAERRFGRDAAQEDEAAPLPFSGPRADFQAYEAEKEIRAQLQAMQSQLSPTLMRSIRSAEDVATNFLPYFVRMVSPDVKPVVVGGSQVSTASVRKEGEKAMVKRAAEVLADLGVVLHKGKIESDIVSSRGPEFVYRMDPDLDALSTFETGASLLSSQAPVRFAVRQVLDQELQRILAQRAATARQARFLAGGDLSTTLVPIFNDKENVQPVGNLSKNSQTVKKDFFGRIVAVKPLGEVDGNSMERKGKKKDQKVWVTFHEGLNNAVRRPMSLQDFLTAL